MSFLSLNSSRRPSTSASAPTAASTSSPTPDPHLLATPEEVQHLLSQNETLRHTIAQLRHRLARGAPEREGTPAATRRGSVMGRRNKATTAPPLSPTTSSLPTATTAQSAQNNNNNNSSNSNFNFDGSLANGTLNGTVDSPTTTTAQHPALSHFLTPLLSPAFIHLSLKAHPAAGAAGHADRCHLASVAASVTAAAAVPDPG